MFIGTVAIPALCGRTVAGSYQHGSIPSSYHVTQRRREIMTGVYNPADLLRLR
jgi:hypothetical protein